MLDGFPGDFESCDSTQPTNLGLSDGVCPGWSMDRGSSNEIPRVIPNIAVDGYVIGYSGIFLQ